MKTIPEELRQEIRNALSEVSMKSSDVRDALTHGDTLCVLDSIRQMRGILADVSRKLEALEGEK